MTQHKGGDFTNLCELHFQMAEGIETSAIKDVYNILELCILFTDILDDIEDGDETKWGIERNILLNASTSLISILFIELKRLEMPYQNEVIMLFYNYLLQAADGQHHDLTNNIISEEAYLGVVKKKSGSLIALACTLGQTLANGKYEEKLEKCAHYIAIVAQLRNDYEDLLGMQKDISMKKRTLPILYLLQYESPMFDELRAHYIKQTDSTTDTHITSQQIEASGLPIYMHLMTLKYHRLAMDLLQQLYPDKDISIFRQYI
ncbi:polyprenyl synthetase family protein [Lysinibacillus sp. NPDC056232]|uniref:polyprenyl synthetase family protein n=1 Tax=Lysinibacillus sp. NPDC056232 TaxID=3345756 RepID=UPI0035DBDEB4